MSDYTRTDIGSGYNSVTSVNTELDAVETAVNSKVDKSGSTMTGDLDMNSNQILNLLDATTDQEPATYSQLLGLFTSSNFTSADAKFIDTMALATADTSLEAGNVVIVKDRANGVFDVISGTGTANTYNIVAHDTFNLSLELRSNEIVNVKQFGATGDGTTDDNAAIQAAIDYAGTVITSIGGGQDADLVTATVFFPDGKYNSQTSIDMVNSVTLRGNSKGSVLLTTDQDINLIEYPDISPSYYTSTNIFDIALENTTGNVGKGIHAFRLARNNHFDHISIIGFLRNIHVEDSFTLHIDHYHGMGQSSDHNIMITGTEAGELILTNSRLDGSVDANIYWNETDRGELVIRDTSIQACQQEAILSRTCQHVTLENVFFENCYQSSAVAGYWLDLQGATARPNGVTTGAIVTNCSFAGSTDSGTDPNGLGLVKFNVFDHVEYKPKWARHYNGTVPTVTAVKNFVSPRAYLDSSTPYPDGLGINTNQDDISVSAQLALSSDYDISVTNAGLEIRTRTDAGSAWTYSGIYKRGDLCGIWKDTATAGLTGTPIIAANGGVGEIHDGNGDLHFRAKDDGFTFMPQCYNNTDAGAANVVVNSSGNMQRSTSSRRWKTNERVSTFKTSDVYSLEPVLFDYKNKTTGEIGQKDCTSFIAEDSGIFAALDEQGIPEGINWNLITLSLVEEIKKLKDQLESK